VTLVGTCGATAVVGGGLPALDVIGYGDGRTIVGDVIVLGATVDEFSRVRTEYGEGNVHNDGRIVLGGELGGVKVGIGDILFGSG